MYGQHQPAQSAQQQQHAVATNRQTITIKRIQTDDMSGDTTLPVTVSFDVFAQKTATDG